MEATITPHSSVHIKIYIIYILPFYHCEILLTYNKMNYTKWTKILFLKAVLIYGTAAGRQAGSSV